MLNLTETIGLSFESVLAHKVRSILTVLGVVFGVAAVLAMLSIGEGAKQETLEQISVMGLHNVIVRASTPESEDLSVGDKPKITNSSGLCTKDAEAIASECPFAVSVEANAEHRKTALYESVQIEVPVIGVSPEYAKIYLTSVSVGRFITEDDVKEIANYCVLGSAAKQKLFAFKKALGEHVKLGDQWFTVIGVADAKPHIAKFAGPNDRDVNLDVFVPVTTAQSKFGREKDVSNTNRIVMNGQTFGGDNKPPPPEIDQITVKLRDDADAAGAAAIISRILTRRHNNAPDFSVTVPEELLRQSQQTQRIFDIVMIAIAGISLLVGGIGIMNIMLASVLERTREIGIRRALGATQRVVISQFLTEAVILSMSGGLLGLAVGFLMTKTISTYAEWRTIVTASSVIISFGVSVATGILFGYYPARQAARKDPIDALRYE